MQKAELRELLEEKIDVDIPRLSQENVASSIAYLSSAEAMESIQVDPYWPKWNSPWWHSVLLFEIGEAKKIPPEFLDRITTLIDSHYLKFFPFFENEIPPGKNGSRHIMCHCALGSIEQVLHQAGVDVYGRLPWVRNWYMKYQLADGGLNCDEAAYTKTIQKSSVVSTLPPLEAVLNCRNEQWNQDEIVFLERGANYLIERKLFRSKSSADVIDSNWLKLTFPRFYFYDFLRGLNFLVSWSLKTKSKLPLSSIEESLNILARLPLGIASAQYDNLHNSKTLSYRKDASGNEEWIREEASFFPLLDEARFSKNNSLYLTLKWQEAKDAIAALLEEKLLI